MLSTSETDFILKGFNQNLRGDGRGACDMRTLSCSSMQDVFGCGSASLSIGDITLQAVVRCDTASLISQGGAGRFEFTIDVFETQQLDDLSAAMYECLKGRFVKSMTVLLKSYSQRVPRIGFSVDVTVSNGERMAVEYLFSLSTIVAMAAMRTVSVPRIVGVEDDACPRGYKISKSNGALDSDLISIDFSAFPLYLLIGLAAPESGTDLGVSVLDMTDTEFSALTHTSQGVVLGVMMDSATQVSRLDIIGKGARSIPRKAIALALETVAKVYAGYTSSVSS